MHKGSISGFDRFFLQLLERVRSRPVAADGVDQPAVSQGFFGEDQPDLVNALLLQGKIDGKFAFGGNFFGADGFIVQEKLDGSPRFGDAGNGQGIRLDGIRHVIFQNDRQ